MKFSIKDFFSKCGQIPADLFTFTEEILNQKLHFLCSVSISMLVFHLNLVDAKCPDEKSKSLL